MSEILQVFCMNLTQVAAIYQKEKTKAAAYFNERGGKKKRVTKIERERENALVCERETEESMREEKTM